jgi:hypothetical protein
MRDLFNNLTPASSLDPQDIGSNTTTNGTDIVRDDSFSMMAVMQVGNYTDGKFYINVQHADDDGNGNPDSWSDVADKFLLGTEAGTSLTKSGVAKIGYIGGKEHVRFNVVSDNGADATVSCLVLKGHLNFAPDSAQRIS